MIFDAPYELPVMCYGYDSAYYGAVPGGRLRLVEPILNGENYICGWGMAVQHTCPEGYGLVFPVRDLSDMFQKCRLPLLQALFSNCHRVAHRKPLIPVLFILGFAGGLKGVRTFDPNIQDYYKNSKRGRPKNPARGGLSITDWELKFIHRLITEFPDPRVRNVARMTFLPVKLQCYDSPISVRVPKGKIIPSAFPWDRPELTS